MRDVAVAILACLLLPDLAPHTVPGVPDWLFGRAAHVAGVRGDVQELLGVPVQQ